MDGLSAYFQMGGYAAFVWPAYVLGAAGIIGILVLSIKSWKAREAEFSKLKAAREDGASA